MRQRIGWLFLLATFVGLNALLFSNLHDSGKSGVIQASALGFGFR